MHFYLDIIMHECIIPIQLNKSSPTHAGRSRQPRAKPAGDGPGVPQAPVTKGDRGPDPGERKGDWAMKRITLRCSCGRSREFHGQDVDEIMQAIDKSGWQDTPKGRPDTCPKCANDPNLGYEDS